MTSYGAATSGVMPHIAPMRDPPSESSASPQASSTTRSSAVSYQNPRSSLSPSPSQVYINQENLTAPATNSQVVALGEQLNILIALAHKNAREYSRWQKKVTKVLVEVGTKLDVPTDGLESEDEDPAGDLA